MAQVRGEADWLEIARSITERGLWCVIETCSDVAAQRWAPALLICTADARVLTDEVGRWSKAFPAEDLRVAGYSRDALHRDGGAPTAICHLAASP